MGVLSACMSICDILPVITEAIRGYLILWNMSSNNCKLPCG